MDDVNGRVKISPETPEKREGNRVTFPLQEFIPSDRYFMYQISYLWEDEYSLALEKLEESPEQQAIIRNNYKKSGIGGYALSAKALKDVDRVESLVSIFTKTGTINASADFVESLVSIFTKTGKINASKEKRFFVWPS